jgi:Sugar transferases involved in lipopolysaccharide synthesis
MMTTQEENRNITHLASIIITVLMEAAFVAVWLLYYNNIAFRTHRELGAVGTILVWLILYLKFCQTYRAFKIASSSIGETAFTQFLSIGFANLILYIGACLIARRYVNVLPGAAAVIVQILLGFIWATKAKQYFLNHVSPKDCILLYDGDVSDKERIIGRAFADKLESHYGHLFNIVQNYPVYDVDDITFAEISKYPVIFIYELPLEKRSKITHYCVDSSKRVYITPTVEDIIARGYDVKHFIDTPLFAYNGSFKVNQTYLGKRTLDIFFSLFALVIASPIMLITAIAIKMEDGGDVFFRQKRATQGDKVFDVLKFRSMLMDAEKDGKPHPCVAGDSRITKVGKFIRATRIDELPQIFNILSGNMSWVGPRVERIEHVDLFTKEIPEFSYRLRVKGGLTGYAQIYGKYNTSAHDKLLLDLLYIEQQSFLMDLRIIFLTIKTVFTPEATEGFDEEKSKAINQQSKDVANCPSQVKL